LLVYLLVFAVVLVAALLAFGLAFLLHLQGIWFILFVSIVLLLGIGAAVVILVIHFRRKKEREAGDTVAAGVPGELDLLLNDANRKLKTAQQGSRTLNALPLIYILGDAGTAKTTQVMRSGLDPELLGGTAPRSGEAVPTPLVNLWITREAALLEAGEAIRQTPSLLTRLIERTRPKAYKSAFGEGAAARAAVVCLSAEQLQAADAGTALMASARATGAQLREISRLLGTPLPVYVLVTKLDRVPYFADFVRNLSNEEAAQILGVPLAKSDASAGVYAERASNLLTGVLDALSYTLGEFRVEMLSRETDPRNSPAVYEFPREFGKLRKNLNQYLVELCKPSHLSVNPYLRGFYFTGIRAQIVEQMAGPAIPVAEPDSQIGADAGATQYLKVSLGKSPSARPTPQPTKITTRVPQWTFLPRLFPQVILGDKSAQSATRQTAPARLFRRILFATLGLLFIVYTILLTVSYFNNAAIEQSILDVAHAIPLSSGALATPTLADLKALDQLRQTILQLDGYEKDGAPLSYRWGLYQGDKLDSRARRVYYDRFLPRLLVPAQSNFVVYLHGLPDAPAPGADYALFTAAYSPLKAYLITAGNHDKSTSQFLTPVFLQYWQGSRPVDAVSQDLARKQIDFYAGELARKDPYAIQADSGVVQHARGYINSFGGETRIYQAMLSDADKKNPGIDFNILFPGSARYVEDARHVSGAYTRTGFAFMKDAIANVRRYFGGESWVLGDNAGQGLDENKIRADLATQYPIDFIAQWKDFLAKANEAGCGSLKETPDKLTALAGSGSPLLELLYTVSHNTAVDDPQIRSTFQASQKMVDSEAVSNFIGPGNKDYVGQLLNIAGVVSQIASAPPSNDPNAGQPITAATIDANKSLQITAQGFPADPQSQTDKKRVFELLQQPISCAGGQGKGVGAAGAKEAGAKICGAMRPLLAKYPFNPNATTEATVNEVNQVFAPDTGVLWSVYNATLKPLIPLQGTSYVAAPGPVNPAYVQFFNRAAQVSGKLYPAGSQSPTINFTLRFIASPGVSNPAVVVDAQRIGNGAALQQFKWSGADAHKASLVYDGGEIPFQGTWALFNLVKLAQRSHLAETTRLDFPITTAIAGHTIAGSTTKGVSYELGGPGADLLIPGYFSGLNCGIPVIK